MKRPAPWAFALYGALSLHGRSELQFLRIISKLHPIAAHAMTAVRDTYRILEASKKHEVILAVQSVYGYKASLPFRKREISRRVRRFAVENYMDDRNVYRRLAEAAKLYSEISESSEKRSRIGGG